MPAPLALLAIWAPWLLPWLPILGWSAAGVAVLSLLGVNYWLDLVEWKTAGILTGMMALVVAATYSASILLRAGVSCALVVVALAWGTLDERRRQKELQALSAAAAKAFADEREKELKEEQARLKAQLEELATASTQDPRAEQEALSAEAVDRINQLRGN